MSSEIFSPAYERLNRIVLSLGMEISDPIFSALRGEVEQCRQENKEILVVVDPVLLGIEAVIMHIEAMRAVSDFRAFNLLTELVEAYRRITEAADQEKAQLISSAALKQVLNWQHDCMLAQPAEPVRIDADLLMTIRQEITATGMMVVREAIALLELVHIQKTKKKASANMAKHAA